MTPCRHCLASLSALSPSSIFTPLSLSRCTSVRCTLTQGTRTPLTCVKIHLANMRCAIKWRRGEHIEWMDKAGVGRVGGFSGGRREGGKANVTSHIWLFTSHLADASERSGEKITGLIHLDKGMHSRESVCCFRSVYFLFFDSGGPSNSPPWLKKESRLE